MPTWGRCALVLLPQPPSLSSAADYTLDELIALIDKPAGRGAAGRGAAGRGAAGRGAAGRGAAARGAASRGAAGRGAEEPEESSGSTDESGT